MQASPISCCSWNSWGHLHLSPPAVPQEEGPHFSYIVSGPDILCSKRYISIVSRLFSHSAPQTQKKHGSCICGTAPEEKLTSHTKNKSWYILERQKQHLVPLMLSIKHFPTSVLPNIMAEQQELSLEAAKQDSRAWSEFLWVSWQSAKCISCAQVVTRSIPQPHHSGLKGIKSPGSWSARVQFWHCRANEVCALWKIQKEKETSKKLHFKEKVEWVACPPGALFKKARRVLVEHSSRNATGDDSRWEDGSPPTWSISWGQ